MQRFLLFQDFVEDLRIGIRSLRRVPILTLTIIGTVGVGIGATAAIFSAIDAALLRPLPYAHPDRLVRIYTDAPPFKWRFSAADYLAFREQQTQFEESATYTDRTVIYSDGASSEVVRARVVSWAFLSVLAVRPAIGRDFAEPDGRPGTPPSVVASHAFWQQRLGRRADAIGRPIKLDGAEHTVIATPLLIAAGLLLASLNQLKNVDLGFDHRNVITGSIRLPAAQYQDEGRVRVFWDELARRAIALPGVAGVAFTDGLPPNGAGNINNFDLEDFPAAPGQSQPSTAWVSTTPEYFRVLGLRLLEGRLLDERDALTENLESVVVDRAWARRFFPDGSAVGKRFREGGCMTCPWTSVVGVVSEVKYLGLDKPDDGTVYWPMRGAEGGLARFLVVRTHADPSILLPALQRAVREIDSSVPLSSVATMDDLVAQSLERPQSLSWLVATFALVALVLSVVGIYGVMGYYVQQHLKEIGIRMALGGSSADVLRLVVGHGMRVVVTGVFCGVLAALGLARFLSSLLFGVSAANALTFVTVSGALLVVALAACLVPARRAAATQPATVLRND